MRRTWKALLVGAAVIAVVAVAAGFGFAASGEDDEPLTGSQLERATTAALEAVGPGEVVGSEAGDDDGAAYEIEVLLSDGSQVEVQLDQGFTVIATEPDDDSAGDQGDDED
jgi:hypothetical protein